MTIYKKNVQDPWFSYIRCNLKTVEGRLRRGDFAKMRVGDIIDFVEDSLGFERKTTKVILGINYYDTLSDYLEKEGLEKCLPGITTKEAAFKEYNKYYTQDEIREYGIVALILRI